MEQTAPLINNTMKTAELKEKYLFEKIPERLKDKPVTGERKFYFIESELDELLKEHAIEFACHALIGTGKMKDKDIPTLRQECTDYYENSEWEKD